MWIALGVIDAFSPAKARDHQRVQPEVCRPGFFKRDGVCVAVAQISDAEIRQQLIAQSIAAYPGTCPCPYFADRAGRSCGARSAWSRAGGYVPLCYPADVSNEAVEKFRRSQPANRY